jgi:Leucine-rich repeat (LRR) protein
MVSMNATALIRDLLLNPSPDNHLKLMEIIDEEEDLVLLDYVQQHLKEWDVEWERHGISDFERFSSPLIRILSCCNKYLSLSSIPENLENLEKLYCWGMLNLTQLPENLKNLKELYCSRNELTSLPENLGNLEELYCDENNLTSLPNCLENLRVLWCSGNKLTELPENLGNLEELLCRGVPLTSLPETLSHNLRLLNCRETQIARLPENLGNLEELFCSRNQFSQSYLDEIRSKWPQLRIDLFNDGVRP